jgi:hypothetical protein
MSLSSLVIKKCTSESTEGWSGAWGGDYRDGFEYVSVAN